MVKELTSPQEKAIHDLYYKRLFQFGRDRIWRKLNDEGVRISKVQVMNWLHKQETWQVFKRPKRERIVRSTIVQAPGRVVGIDLADAQTIAWDGFRYFLTGIDLFSKKGYARALLNKKKETVAEAMENMLAEIGHVGSIRSDNGSEFVNPLFKRLLADRGIKQVLSLPAKPWSNGQIERFNGVLKQMIRRAMRASSSRDWPGMLDRLVANYNASRQETTGMTPDEASKLKPGETDDVVERTKARASAMAEPPKLRKGDTVRVVKKTVYNDGELWSKQLYTIDKVIRPKTPFGSVIYRVEKPANARPQKRGEPRPDWAGNLYEESVQLVEAVENTRDSKPRWFISKLVRRATKGGEPGFIVKWTTGEETFEPTTSLTKDVPKLLQAFR